MFKKTLAVVMHSNPDAIRVLNDHLRITFTGGCILVTASIAGLDAQLKARVLLAVREFNDFSSDIDPHHEHDLAFFEVDGERYFSKSIITTRLRRSTRQTPQTTTVLVACSQSATTRIIETAN